LRQCINISALPEWLGELSSLESLTIWWCTGITSFPPSIQQLTELQTLKIVSNVKLKRWCESKDNKKKLVGIKNIVSSRTAKLQFYLHSSINELICSEISVQLLLFHSIIM
jgi:hypothetical protein